jgi:hypothetical protein
MDKKISKIAARACKICKLKNLTTTEKNEHDYVVHGIKFCCDICGVSFRAKDEVKENFICYLNF